MKIKDEIMYKFEIVSVMGSFALSELRGLFCKHEETTTITNFYGDAINTFDCRSWRRCNKCGKIIKSEDLDPECNKVNVWWE